MLDAGFSIRVNGERREVPSGQTVSGLLETVGLAGRPVVVERNGAALFPREFPVTRLEEGDRVEIVRVVAGG
jgi:sulfur carrier protein